MDPQLTPATVTTAANLAAAGDHAGALALLDSLPPEPIDPEASLLRGKILAQTGRFDEAIAVWQKILSVQPDHAEARQAIAAAEELRRAPAPSLYLRANLIFGLLIAVILLLAGLLFWTKTGPAPLPATGAEPRPSSDAWVTQLEQSQRITAQQLAQILERLESLERLTRTSSPGASGSSNAPVDLAPLVQQTTRLAEQAAEYQAATRRDLTAISTRLASAEEKTAADLAQLREPLDQTRSQLRDLAAAQAEWRQAVSELATRRDLDRLRADTAELVELSRELERMTASYDRLSRRLHYLTAAERRQAQQDLEALRSRLDAQLQRWQAR